MQKTFGRGNHLKLVDGSGFVFRAYHALPPLTRSDGLPVGAVAGFCNMIFRMIEKNITENKTTHLAVIFDHKSKTFRSDIYPEYKANRPPAPDDLIPQFELIKKATLAFNIPCIEVKGYEADDIIASYAVKARDSGAEVTIISSDKDLMQLVGNGISMFDSMKNKKISSLEVKEKFGVEPSRVIDVQSLAGDSTDNIPGAPGIGIKTAAQLINEYGDLDNLLNNAKYIKQPKRRESLIENAKLIRISQKLVTLNQNTPTPLELSDLEIRNLDIEKSTNFTQEMEFKTLTKRIETKFGLVKKEIPNQNPNINKTKRYDSLNSSEILNIPYENYTTITELKVLLGWVKTIKEQGFCSIDTETTSLNELKAELVGISLAVAPGEACYIPLSHKRSVNNDGDLFHKKNLLEGQLTLEVVLDVLRPLFQDSSILKVGQNIKYDIKVLSKYKVHFNSIDDTMLISYCINGGKHRHGMNLLSNIYLDHEATPISALIGNGKSAITFDLVPIDVATKYAAEDADITLRLWKILKPKLSSNSVCTIYETMERKLIPILAEIELSGVLINKQHLTQISDSLSTKMLVLEKKIYEISGYEFNVGSPKQLGEILFEKIGLPGGKKNKTGAYSTGAEVLEKLTYSGNELAEQVLEWRQLSKLKSTYADALREHINRKTGRVHTSYIMSGTTTGRLASAEPNLQNIPIRSDEGKKIREAFIAKPKHKIVSFDYSQIELRVLAQIADIQNLKKAFLNSVDIHTMTACEMFNLTVDDMTPEIRRRAKAINFGVIYGISAFGLANNLRIPREEAAKFIKTYFERFPGIKSYMDKTIKIARADNYVETLFGRRIHIPNINSKGNLASFAQRAAINAPIQGTAADIIKRAMIKIPAALAQNNLSAVMILQVHDELLFEVPISEIKTTIEKIRFVMETACDPIIRMDIPLIVDSGIGNNWSEAH